MIQNEQNWGGINERIHPFLLPLSTFSHSEGLTYRSGKGCRVNGKTLLYKFDSMVLSIMPFRSIAILQTANKIVIFKMSDIFPAPNVLLTDELGNTLSDELGNDLAVDF